MTNRGFADQSGKKREIRHRVGLIILKVCSQHKDDPAHSSGTWAKRDADRPLSQR